MIDFGLVALVVLLLLMTFATGLSYMSIKRELALFEPIKTMCTEALKNSREALLKVDQIDKEQYQSLAKKIFSIEEKLQLWNRQFSGYDEEFKSLSMRIAALKRWRGGKKDDIIQNEQGAEVETPNAEQVDFLNTVEDMGIKNQVNIPNFGQKARKVA